MEELEEISKGGPHSRSLCCVHGANLTCPLGHSVWHFWHISQGWSGKQKVPFLQAHYVFLVGMQGLTSTWSSLHVRQPRHLGKSFGYSVYSSFLHGRHWMESFAS